MDIVYAFKNDKFCIILTQWSENYGTYETSSIEISRDEFLNWLKEEK